jgi:uncharacterized protein (TIGR03435 family)
MGHMRRRAKAPWSGRRKLFLAAGSAALAVLIVLTLTVSRLRANPTTQSLAVSTDRPKFDVASIKQDSSAQFSMTGIEPGGRLVANSVQLRTLIAWAYQLKPDQAKLISGLPDWAKSKSFDIDARAQNNPPREQLLLMLQSLLADRFKLTVHRETREVPVYALVATKAGRTGPQLQPHSDAAVCLKADGSRPAQLSDFGVTPPPPPPCGRFISGAHRLAGNNVTMESLAANLGALSSVDRPVVDRTGLSGTFDLSLNYTSQAEQSGSEPGTDADASDPSASPSIFTALQEQLGLKLQPQTGPADILVIDHIEEPSGN